MSTSIPNIKKREGSGAGPTGDDDAGFGGDEGDVLVGGPPDDDDIPF
jgi:hypothetical protein